MAASATTMAIPSRSTSKVLPPTYFIRGGKNFTRYHERRIRETFPFLSLAPELRTIIYDLCINVDGIEKYFDRAYQALRRKSNAYVVAHSLPLAVSKTTPTILLLCRQIYVEAVGLLQKKSVNFHHGLLLSNIRPVVSPNLLRSVGTINITAKGHTVLARHTMGPSWHGYLLLITKLGQILSKGHKLKHLTIDLEESAHSKLHQHMIHCWHNERVECDFRNQMIEAFGHLHNVRGIKHVTLKGLDPTFALSLKTRLESTPPHLLTLPGEIRNRIYDFCTDYSTLSSSLGKMMKSWMRKPSLRRYPKTSTPTILLLNRQIYEEAHSRLQATTLTITCPRGTKIERQHEVPNLFRLVSPETLQSIHHLEFRIESWEWMFAVERLIPVLLEQHKLKTFKFVFDDSLKKDFWEKDGKIYPDRAIATCLKALVDMRGVGKVVFEGDLPGVYTRPLVKAMSAAEGEVVAGEGPMAVAWDGRVVDLEFEELNRR